MNIYLYVKSHAVTGLKYFGKTTRDPYTYNGSGLYWTRHIGKHGKQHVITERVWTFEDQQEATSFALAFSIDNNIVLSENWANMKNEDALMGWGRGNEHNRGRALTQQHKSKIAESHKGLTYLKGHVQSTAHKKARNGARKTNGWFKDPKATARKIQTALGTKIDVTFSNGVTVTFPSKSALGPYLGVSRTTAINLCLGKVAPSKYNISSICIGQSTQG